MYTCNSVVPMQHTLLHSCKIFELVWWKDLPYITIRASPKETLPFLSQCGDRMTWNFCFLRSSISCSQMVEIPFSKCYISDEESSIWTSCISVPRDICGNLPAIYIGALVEDGSCSPKSVGSWYGTIVLERQLVILLVTSRQDSCCRWCLQRFGCYSRNATYC